MKVKHNGIYILIINFLTIFFCSASLTKTYRVDLSFDSLFPRTWYQKGLESSLYVWQTLINVFEKTKDEASLSFDTILGRLAFAQFCINRMRQEDVPCIADDAVYFTTVLQKIQQLLMVIAVTSKTHDFIICADDMIVLMQEELKIKK